MTMVSDLDAILHVGEARIGVNAKGFAVLRPPIGRLEAMRAWQTWKDGGSKTLEYAEAGGESRAGRARGAFNDSLRRLHELTATEIERFE